MKLWPIRLLKHRLLKQPKALLRTPLIRCRMLLPTQKLLLLMRRLLLLTLLAPLLRLPPLPHSNPAALRRDETAGMACAMPAFSLPALSYDRVMKRTLFLLGTLALLAACGERDTAPGPGGVTVGEAKALDEAAEMIEARRLPDGVLATDAPEAASTASSAPSPSPSAAE